MNNLAALRLSALGWLYLPQWRATIDHQPQVAQATLDPLAAQHHHLAWHCAYRQWVALYPQWAQRRFDAEFLRRFISSPALPTAAELARAWDQQFGPLTRPVARCQQVAELTEVAACFLRLYQRERRQVTEMSA